MTDEPATSRSASAAKWLLLAAALAALWFVGRNAAAEIPRFAEWVAGLGAIGPVVFIVGYAVAVVAFVPGSALTLAAGFVFGLWRGVLFAFTAAMLGSALSFLVSRYVARSAIERRIAGNERFAAVDRAVAAEGRRIVFLLRLSPAFPFTLLNYALGLTKIRFVDFIVASVGMLPGTFLFVYYGKLAGDVAALASGAAPVDKGTGYYGVLAIGLVATITVTAFVTRIARKALAEATGEAAPAAQRLAASESLKSGTMSTTNTMNTANTMSKSSEPDAHTPVTPLDEHNRRLLDNVRPPDWTNPAPAALYDLVVVGAGTGGLISAAVGAGLGAKVALVERNLMGGDCLNYGCVPSKTLIRDSRRVVEARAVAGVTLDDTVLDAEFAAAMERLRKVRADISHDDSARRFRDELGVDVFHGQATFTGPASVAVGGVELRFKKAVIASGARADIPPIPGLADAAPLTNETVFNLTRRPRRLVVLGGGPIGCELAQAMRRFGCDVALVDREARLLPNEGADAAALLEKRLIAEGVRLVLGAEAVSVEASGGQKTIRFRDGSELAGDDILVATGRRANIDGMDLERAGVTVDKRGIVVDDHLRTANARIFAVGDCAMRWQFTHAADAAAKLAVQNALFFGRKKLSSLVMPWVTYTDPEIAHVGLTDSEARERNVEIDTLTIPLEKVNRAACDGETDGFVRVHVRKGSDVILGATIVATHAGEMISEVSLAIVHGLGLAKIAAVIHPYPTQAEGIKAAANAYMRTKLTPAAKKFLGLLLRLQR